MYNSDLMDQLNTEQELQRLRSGRRQSLCVSEAHIPKARRRSSIVSESHMNQVAIHITHYIGVSGYIYVF